MYTRKKESRKTIKWKKKSIYEPQEHTAVVPTFFARCFCLDGRRCGEPNGTTAKNCMEMDKSEHIHITISMGKKVYT